MNIGDRVRLIHGREEGIITRLLQGNQLEIEIEDGFRIPILKSEVVLVSPLEKEKLARPVAPKNVTKEEYFVPASRNQVFATKGIYFAFVLVNDRECTSYLLNNTDWQLPYTLTGLSSEVNTGLSAGILAPRTSQRISNHFIKDMETWPQFELHALYFRDQAFDPQPVLHKKLRVRAQSFFNKKQSAPLLQKDAFLYQLDEEGEAPAPKKMATPEEIRNSMLSGRKDPAPAEAEKAVSIVDLHIEKIQQEFTDLSANQILGIQISTFEKHLEKAIGAGMDDITFVHGIGNGTLRSELHRRLGKHPNVAFYKDAQKEKFGFGATFVKIK